MMRPASPLERWLPCLVWGRQYSAENFGHDLLAAVIVTIMLIPQSLAYAMLAGLPPYIGLYASILPLVAYGLFGTSRTLAVGPVAVISLMTAAAAAKVAAPGSPAYIEAALILAFLSGLILVAMAVMRLGFLANFLSHPVISGFISASGLLIAAGQLKHILGIPAGGETLPQIASALAARIDGTNLPTLLIGGFATLFLFLVRRSLKKLLMRMGLPARAADLFAKAGPVFAIIVSILLVRQFDLAAAGVRIVGSIPQGLPPLTLPRLDTALWADLLPAALLLSLVGFVESISVAQTLAAKRRQRITPDSELLGLGAANLAAAFSGGYPVTGGFARSVVNFDAGAVTPLAGGLTAIFILLTTLFLTPLFHDLPQAVLSATIIVAVLSLVDLRALPRVWRYSRHDFVAMAATMVVVLGVGVEAGIVTGVALSLVLFLWRTSRPHVAIVGLVPGSEHFRNVERNAVLVSESVLSIRIDESLYFANARALEDRIYAEMAERPSLRHVVLMCPAVNLIDASALESLEAIQQRLKDAGITFHLSEVKGPVMDALAGTAFLDHLRHDGGRIFLSQYAAVAALDPDLVAGRRADGSKATLSEPSIAPAMASAK
ncbi:SulP family sulfate permease [Dongia mobilis]|uniref:SulP family sulfate permease n=1 Tax=Dongia mobilis TaxID=578943 RepID=A0A4R6WZ28_9PROT|nr:sulfate permease [Dongia mobilis]TDQ85509.1 SulP family sulfate permease [Dongia mobilis]